MEYGYVRVSDKTQNEERQIVDLLHENIERKNIYVDKQSGRDFERPGYKRLLNRLRKGDTIFVKSIDRFGRNYAEILEQWSYLTKKKKVDIVVLDMPLLDTRRNKDLLGELIADLVLQILSYVAETQRASIKQNQADGIRLAKERGVLFGRPRKLQKEEFILLNKKVESGEWSRKKFCDETGISIGTYYAYKNEYIKENQAK